ncbi:MAG: S1 RNA-binding domain-containing protein, partial [Chloroflexi bacterium]|nr:S1 RNA-binding domain-containing protein [Chloroflexota bacterium]
MMPNHMNLDQDERSGDESSDVENTTPAAQDAELSEPTATLTESAPDEVMLHEVAVSAAEMEDAPPAVDESEDESAEDEPAEAEEEPVEGAARVRAKTVVEGVVLATSPTEVLVDLGEGLVGVIASRELERMDRAALEALHIGGTVVAFVLKAKGSDGRPVLSLARAEEENNWRLAEEHHRNKQVYFSKVAGYNKGGLIVRFGKVRGFVPASQISRERQQRAAGESPEERWSSMVGEDMAVKVVEIDRARNRLILSERAA